LIENSFELLKRLKELGHIKDNREWLWWPNSGTFEVVVGAILTQNTKWENVEKSLQNIKKHTTMNLDGILRLEPGYLGELIRPSGFYNQKSVRLRNLCSNIKVDFGTFEHFCDEVSREWLLAQKGVGEESADAILNYSCKRDVMVVDKYTDRLLRSVGYEFESYGDIQEWLKRGIDDHLDEVYELYGKELELFEIYARFHGKIVEFSKVKSGDKIF